MHGAFQTRRETVGVAISCFSARTYRLAKTDWRAGLRWRRADAKHCLLVGLPRSVYLQTFHACNHSTVKCWQCYGWNKYGWNKYGWNKYGWNKYGWNKYGWNKYGWNKYILLVRPKAFGLLSETGLAADSRQCFGLHDVSMHACAARLCLWLAQIV
eukprot:354879-Chlamydomonas_euryale.AAC.12